MYSLCFQIFNVINIIFNFSFNIHLIYPLYNATFLFLPPDQTDIIVLRTKVIYKIMGRKHKFGLLNSKTVMVGVLQTESYTVCDTLSF